MRKKLGNRGFSLVEVLIGVTILAIIAVPLAHAFITSAKTSAKAQNIRSETIAAQNILESYEATNIAMICSRLAVSDTSFAGGEIDKFRANLEETGWTQIYSAEQFADLDTEGPGYEITLTGIMIDKNIYTYDAVLNIVADDDYEDINASEVVNAKPMSAVFNLRTDNPDIMAATEIARQAQIDLIAMLEAADEEGEEGEAIEVPVLTYSDFIDKMERVITITISASGEINAQFSYHASYNGNPYDVSLPYPIPGDPYEEGVDYGFYFFYYPNQNPTTFVAPNLGTDEIHIYNKHNLEMNIYLVRQEINDVQGYNPDLNAPQIKHYETHESLDDLPAALVYTNFLIEEYSTPASYFFYPQNESRFKRRKCDGTLGGKAAENRLYQVSVDLYEQGKAGDPDALLLQMDASSVE